ncbi:MAG: 30S ribosomal protein S5 [Allopontixanthobacter sediminis]
MMADDKKTDETPAATPEATVEETKVQPETEAAPAAEAPVEAKEEAAPAADAPAEPVIDNAGSTPTPTMASTEAADNQSAAGGAPSQPRSGRGGGNNRGGGHGGQGGGQGGNRDGGRGGRGGRDGNRRGGRDDQPDDGLVEKLVHINRVSKTVKGGKRFGFAALVVVGDGAGRVGFGKGKAREVPEAITKATAAAKKKMIRVSLKEGRTLHHDGRGRFGAGKVAVRSAPAGTGIIAGGPMRAVFESLGVADVVTKSIGTSNPYNMIRATFDALVNQTSPKSVAQRRGKKVADLLGRGGASDAEAQAEAAAVTE